MSECTGNCSSCKESCEKKDLMAPLNASSSVAHVFAIVSGKGGVGKSMTTAMLASLFARKGYKVGVLDADVTGPSMPRMFGAQVRATGDDLGINPVVTASGIKLMSINLLLEDEESPVVWRGPIVSDVIRQFWFEVNWGDIDVMFIDMPPGTGDVPLTVFQSLPVDGVITVTTPQELVSMIVKKACNMAELMNIPMLGLIENMSYALCPDCGRKIELFGKSKTAQIAKQMGLPLLAQVPFDAKLAGLCDEGEIERVSDEYLGAAVEELEGKYMKDLR